MAKVNIKGELFEINETPWSDRVKRSEQTGFADWQSEIDKIDAFAESLSEIRANFSLAGGSKSVGNYPVKDWVQSCLCDLLRIEREIRLTYCDKNNQRATLESILAHARIVVIDRIAASK